MSDRIYRLLPSDFRLFLCVFCICLGQASAQPSSLFWTVCTTQIEETGNGHLNVGNYFTVWDRRRHDRFLAPDIGFSVGLFTWRDWSLEAGVDYFGGIDDPVYFNAKIGIPEGKLFQEAPSFSFGIFDVGTRTKGPCRTNQNVLDIVLGKALPDWIGGDLFVGAYSGGSALDGDRQGWMIAYERNFCPATDCDEREYYKWIFVADYASGKNWLGGGGFGLTYCFTPDITIQTGPVWFNSKQLYGDWKWSVQIDFDFCLFAGPKKSDASASDNWEPSHHSR